MRVGEAPETVAGHSAAGGLAAKATKPTKKAIQRPQKATAKKQQPNDRQPTVCPVEPKATKPRAPRRSRAQKASDGFVLYD